jgi:hypothetical protein
MLFRIGFFIGVLGLAFTVRVHGVEIVSVSGTLNAPQADGALVVGAGGILELAARAPEAVRADIGEYLRTAGFNVIHLSGAESREELAELAQLVQAAGLPVSGPGREPALLEVEGGKLAFFGAESEEELAGALERVPEGTVAVLLTQQDPVHVAQWMRREARVSLALVSRAAPLGTDAVRVAEGRYLAMVPTGRLRAAHSSLTLRDGALVEVANRSEAVPLERSPQVRAFHKQRGVESNRGAAVLRQVEAPAAEPQRVRPLESLDAEETAAVQASGQTHAVELRVQTAALRDEYAGAEGRFIVLSTTWENVIPISMAWGQPLPTVVRFEELSNHLYLVLNNRQVLRLREDTQDQPGHLRIRPLELPEVGAVAAGNLVFEAPDEPIESLELRLYDFAHGHLALKLVESAEAAARGEEEPIGPVQGNEVVEAGVFGVERLAELEGQAAPDGMRFVRVDLRGRSMFTFEADATAFDPQARAGDKIEIGTVGDWSEAHRHTQLVVDGEYAYVPDPELTEMSDSPRMLPDLMTGGRVVFLALAEARSLSLWCDFPNARLPDGRVIQPGGFELPIEGEAPAAREQAAIASIDDEVFGVEVVEQSAVEEFAGELAGDGRRFLVLDVSVVNQGEKSELFQTRPQLKHTAEDGTQSEMHEVTFRGKHPPSELVLIPPKQRRSFQVVYETNAEETRPRLAYAGVSRAEVVELGRVDGAGIVQADPGQPREQEPAVEEPVVEAEPEPAVVQRPEEPRVVEAEEEGPRPGETRTQWQRRRELEALRRVPIHPGHEPKGLAGVGLRAEQVNEAIDRGAEFLWNFVKSEDGLDRDSRTLGWRNDHGIIALALVHADAHERFGDFHAALLHFLRTADPFAIDSTYEVGVLAMLVESYGDPQFLPLLRRCGEYLSETQGKDGSWNYRAQEVKALRDMYAPEAGGEVLEVVGGVPLDDPTYVRPRVERRGDGQFGIDGDNSASQFSLLGLHSASRAGIEIPDEVWEANLSSYRERQGRDGGWAYTTGQSYGSMTCAGICALAINEHELGKDAEVEVAIERALGWLDEHFAVDHHIGHGGHAGWHYYYLYSLELVGRILDTEFVGQHEWYPIGARYLVDAQQADGGWPGGQSERERLGTTFALLFLTRATPALEVEEMKRGGNGTLRTGMVTDSKRLYIILDASGTLLHPMPGDDSGRMKFELVSEAVNELLASVPDGTEVGLRVFGHRKRSIEAGADEDTHLEIPMSPLDRQAFRARLGSIRPRGKTPLALSMREAANDLRRAQISAERPVTVVLVAEGEENTRPRQDPMAAAGELAKLEGIDFHIIGFDIDRAEWGEQLRQIAELVGGEYHAAHRSEDLHQELRAAVFRVPEFFEVVDANGRPVARGHFGDEMTLPEGRYTLRTQLSTQAFEETFWINTDRRTSAIFHSSRLSDLDRSAREPVADAASEERDAPEAVLEEAPPEPAVRPQGRFCTQCGGSLPAGARFCTQCGARVN